MSTPQPRWLDEVAKANEQFRARIAPDRLPVQRQPGSVAVITCMDPRVNLEALGVAQFGPQGESQSPVRVIRTLGGMAESRSLLVGMFLAGIREFALLAHTDCGCMLAHAKIDTIIANMEKRLEPGQLARVKAEVGEPFRDHLIEWLKAFSDPREAVRKEAAAVRALPFMPRDVPVHGLVYDLETGRVEVAVNGYEF